MRTALRIFTRFSVMEDLNAEVVMVGMGVLRSGHRSTQGYGLWPTVTVEFSKTFSID